MPDQLGRYYLQEMQDRVRRELGDDQLTVNTTTNVESSAPVYPTQLYSRTDLNQALNYSMVTQFQEMWTDHEDLFASTFYISIKSGWPGPYALPFNLLKLRWLKMKPPSLSLSAMRPNQWQPMSYYDEDLSQGIQWQFGGTTYRREGDNIILNFIPGQSNGNGIMVNCVVMPPELVNQNDVVDAQFARPLQNFMILDAAVHIADTRQNEVSPHLLEQRERAHIALMATVDNALQPPGGVQLYSTRLVKRTYSGRW